MRKMTEEEIKAAGLDGPLRQLDEEHRETMATYSPLQGRGANSNRYAPNSIPWPSPPRVPGHRVEDVLVCFSSTDGQD